MKNQKTNKIVLVATQEKLRDLCIQSEIPEAVHSLADRNPLWGGMDKYLAMGGKYAYKKYRETDVEKLSTDEMLNLISSNLELGYKIHLVHPDNVDSELNLGTKLLAGNGAIYFEHPLYNGMYLLPSKYSSTMCSEKESTFLRLAGALGAKRIQLEAIQTSDKNSVFGGKFSAKEVAGELGFSANFDKTGSVVKSIYKEFHKPLFSSPVIPKDLAEWVQYDSDLRTMAADRIEANAKMSKVRLEFSESTTFGVNIAGKMAARGFSVGGQTRTLTRSIWSFEVEYYDMSA